MHRIPLRVLPDPDRPGEPGNVISYAVVIREVVRRPLDAQRGVDMDEMRRGIRILDAVDAAAGSTELQLEDADYEHFVQKLNAMQWALVDKRILRFIDDVTHSSDSSLNGIWTEAAAQVG